MALQSTRRRRPPRPGSLNALPPLFIIKTMAVLQLVYYVISTILICFTAIVFGKQVGLGLVLDWRNIRGDTTWGVVLSGTWIAGGFLSVIPLLLLLPRSRLIPDFALTIHFLHLLVTSFYTRAVPTNFLWWGLQMGSSALMIVLGMWGARYREMRPISFGTGAPTSKGTSASKATDPSSSSENDGRIESLGDDGQGFMRPGRGRGRQRSGDELGGYEMVDREERDTGG